MVIILAGIAAASVTAGVTSGAVVGSTAGLASGLAGKICGTGSASSVAGAVGASVQYLERCSVEVVLLGQWCIGWCSCRSSFKQCSCFSTCDHYGANWLSCSWCGI